MRAAVQFCARPCVYPLVSWSINQSVIQAVDQSASRQLTCFFFQVVSGKTPASFGFRDDFDEIHTLRGKLLLSDISTIDHKFSKPLL